MNTHPTIPAAAGIGDLAAKAGTAARLLKLLANERRLLVLCRLATSGEASVSALADAVGLSQSALSQHLSLMREDGLVSFRRDGQSIYYAIADPATAHLLATLRTIFCGNAESPPKEAP